MNTVRRPREFWERVAREVERRGSVSDVAARHGVNERTLSWWCSRLRCERRRKPALLPVVVREPAQHLPGAIELAAHGAHLRIEVGTDVGYLAALVHALGAC